MSIDWEQTVYPFIYPPLITEDPLYDWKRFERAIEEYNQTVRIHDPKTLNDRVVALEKSVDALKAKLESLESNDGDDAALISDIGVN